MCTLATLGYFKTKRKEADIALVLVPTQQALVAATVRFDNAADAEAKRHGDELANAIIELVQRAHRNESTDRRGS